MRGIDRKIEGNNGVVLIELLELGREVALIAIENKHTIYTLPLGIYRLIEVLNPIQIHFIIYLAIQRGFNPLGIGNATLSILGGEVVFALEDQVQRYYKAVATNTLNCCSLFLIAQLKNLMSALLIGTYNNYTTADNTYYKASFIKVVEVYVVNCILCIYIVYQLKLYVYKPRIFIESPLLIIYIQQALLKLRVVLYKALCLVDAS